MNLGNLLKSTLIAACVVGSGWQQPAHAENDPANQVAPGSVVRWPGENLEQCGIGDASWRPINDTCWYPIDLLAPQSPIRLDRTRGGIQESHFLRVGAYPYPEQRLSVAPEMASPPPDQLDRIQRENAQVKALWRSDGPRVFTLPLAPPIESLPKFRSFGSRRVLNGEAKNPHSGVDLSSPTGTPVLAAAAGTVVLVGSHYFSGNSVFIDHGENLITMYFHLDRIDVEQGETVARGQTVGTVGATGRATGPHLHFGVRWHGARVDPAILLMDPESISKVGPDPL